MLIYVSTPAVILDRRDRPVAAHDLPRSLRQERLLSDDALEQYLDFSLTDIGLSAGMIHLRYDDAYVPRIEVDFLAPRKLDENEAAELIGFARTQMSDGAGEGGFDLPPNGELRVEAVEDTGWQVR